MSELDREMLRYLRAYRGETRPTPAQRDGALAGLLDRVRAGDAVALDVEPAAPQAGAAPIRWIAAAASIAALVAGASLVAGERVVDESPPPSSSAAPYDGGVSPPAHEVVEVAPPEPAPRVQRPVGAATSVVPPPPIASPPVEREAVVVAPRRPKPRPQPIVVPPPAIEPSIDVAEVAALRRAQAELSRAPADALAHLVEHASTYPGSSFAAERDVARATALCKLGRGDEARALAVDFEARRPDSPLLPRMRRICTSSRAIADGSVPSSH